MFQSLLSWKLLKGSRSFVAIGATSRSFNPCCHGSCSRAWLDVDRVEQPPVVSILVVMEVAQGPLSHARPLAPRCGFNPCCHGSCSRARRGLLRELGLTMFQSLLSWKLLKGPVLRLTTVISDEFQSLLSWKLLKGSLQSVFLRSSIWVSILVVMEVAQGREPCPGLDAPARGFNPCCHGSCSRASGTSLLAFATVMFQSLLSWKLLKGVQATALQIRLLLGFNPCCHGSCSRASWGCRLTLRCREFQSLLSWKLLKGHRSPRSGRRLEYVSILVVMEVAQGLGGSNFDGGWI